MNKQELHGRMDLILKTARAEGRGLKESEKAEFDQCEAEYRMADLGETRGGAGVETRGVSADLYSGDGVRSDADRNFTRFLRTGEIRTNVGITTSPNSGQSSTDDGGYMVPQGFWQQLTIAMKQYQGMSNDYRQVETDTGNPMPWPTVDPTGVVATLVTTELTQLSTVSPYVFGQGLMGAWTITTSPVLASLQLIEDGAFDIDGFLADRFAESLGREIASLAISGTGSSQPLGIVPALTAKGAWSAGGSGGFLNLTAATNVATLAGTVTELAGNLLSPQTLLNAVKAVDPAYRNAPDGSPLAKFYVNDAQLAGLRTVVDSYGHPLLQDPSHEAGTPTLWGYPVSVDPNIPNLTASTAGGPVFGNLNKAMVMRTVKSGVRVLRLDQRWADYLAVGYLGFYRFDIRSNDLRAAVTVKPAAT